MPGYWWECENPLCNHKTTNIQEGCKEAHSIPSFIRDVLMKSDWNQAHLQQVCPKCGQTRLRIAYGFPRKAAGKSESIRVLQIIGLGGSQDCRTREYLPMMWETVRAPFDSSEPSRFDFKYIMGRNMWGLNKAAVFTAAELRTLFALYADKTKKPSPLE